MSPAFISFMIFNTSSKIDSLTVVGKLKTSDYIYSSTSNYVSGKGILTIEKADPVLDVLRNSSFDNYNSY